MSLTAQRWSPVMASSHPGDGSRCGWPAPLLQRAFVPLPYGSFEHDGRAALAAPVRDLVVARATHVLVIHDAVHWQVAVLRQQRLQLRDQLADFHRVPSSWLLAAASG